MGVAVVALVLVAVVDVAPPQQHLLLLVGRVPVTPDTPPPLISDVGSWLCDEFHGDCQVANGPDHVFAMIGDRTDGFASALRLDTRTARC